MGQENQTNEKIGVVEKTKSDNTKLKGRPKKYEERQQQSFSVGISQYWQEIFEDIVELSQIDDNPDFPRYAKDFEQIDLSKLRQGRLSIYIRYILINHVAKNVHKLHKT